MAPYSIYDYLASILPGATILAATFYAWYGLPHSEPGGALVVGLLAASFVVGQLNSAIGSLLARLLLGRPPGRQPSSVLGLSKRFGDSTYRQMLKAVEEKLDLGGATDDVVFGTAYAQLLGTPHKDMLMTLNEQIAFHRNMMAACAVAIAICSIANVTGRHYMSEALWVVVLVIAGLIFALRTRRFWIQFGVHVLRGAFLLTAPSQSNT